MSATKFRAAEFARIAGITVRTLQYYDRIGLLSLSQVTAPYYHEIINVPDAGTRRLGGIRFFGCAAARPPRSHIGLIWT